MNKKILSLITAFLTAVVMCAAPATAFGADRHSIEKEETVYVITDEHGDQEKVIVSDHLVNGSKADTIKDKSDLTDIENVKGDEKFTKDGSSITWEAGGNDIYYQGNSSRKAPVSMNITYRLDGRTVTGSELQGKSGKVEISISYENTARHEGKLVPMVVMTGLIVTDGCFSDIEIDNGKIIDDGDKQIVAGIAAPGLKDIFSIDSSKLDMGDSIKITGTAKKFNITDMMTIATNNVFEDIDETEFGNLDYDDQINELDRGSKKLVKGTKELSDGLDQLDSGIGKLVGKSGGNSGLIPTFENLKTNVPLLSNGATVVNSSVKSISTSLGNDTTSNTLIWMANVLDTGLNSAAKTVSSSTEAARSAESSIDSAEKKLNSAKDGVSAVNKDVGELKKTLENNKEALEGIESGDSNLYEVLLKEAESINAYSVTENISSAESELNKASDQLDKTEDANESVEGKLSAAESGSGLGTVAAYLHNGLKTMQASISGSESVPSDKTLLYATGALDQGLKKMSDTIEKATDESNPQNVVKALNTVKSGSSELSTGSVKLSTGMSKLYKEGIKKIVDLYNDDLKGLTGSLSDMIDAGKGYRTFTILPENMDGSVQFIYKTKISE